MSGKPQSKAEVLQGTLDLLVLQTLDSLGPLHGYAIAARFEQVSGGALQLNMGTLYPARTVWRASSTRYSTARREAGNRCASFANGFTVSWKRCFLAEATTTWKRSSGCIWRWPQKT